MGKLIDLTGQKFNKLTVIKQDTSKKYSEANWLCQCDCGNYTIVRGTALRNGIIKSCGCYNNELAKNLGKNNKKDLTGQIFGKLTVINDTQKRSRDRQIIWLCKCKCGNTIEVKSGNLISGNTKSCGCLSSYKEMLISQILLKNNIDFETQYKFNDLYLKNSDYPLRFDFAIFYNKKLIGLIEYHGKQHYNDNYLYGKTQREITDKMKIDYCNKNKIKLLILNADNYNEQKILLYVKELINESKTS